MSRVLKLQWIEHLDQLGDFRYVVPLMELLLQHLLLDLAPSSAALVLSIEMHQDHCSVLRLA